MGMAASQSRYLGLTARKINVEYEGQQVNQQRTALANESAGLFRQWMSLEVPTAPSQTDYYEDEYVYNDPANGKTALTKIAANPNTDPQTYTILTRHTENIMQYNSFADKKVTTLKDNEKTYIMFQDGQRFLLSNEQEMPATLASLLNSASGPSTIKNEEGDKYYSFTHSSGATYYLNATKTGFDIDKLSEQSVDFFTSIAVEQQIDDTIENARLSSTSSGAYNNIYWTDEDGTAHSFSLTQSRKYDEEGYNAAMAKYNYDQQVYQKTVSDINAKTKKLEEADRTLELRLKQLDTEQEALQTEMEAVKKVIEKNVENVFKTFQS